MRTYHKIKSIVPPSFRFRSLGVFFSLVINSLVDLFGLGMLIPLISVIVSDDFIQQNQYLSFVYNALGFTNTRYFIVSILALIFLVSIIKNILGVYILKYNAQFTYDLNNYISQKILQQYYKRGYIFYKTYNSHEYLNDILNIPVFFSQGLVLSFLRLLNEGLLTIIILVALLVYDPYVVMLLILLLSPVLFIFYALIKNKIARVNKNLDMLHPKAFSRLYQLIYGFVDVHMSHSYTFFKQKYETLLKEQKKLRVQNEVYMSLSPRIIEIAMISSVLIIVAYGIFFYPNREQLIGLFGVFMLASYKIMPSLNKILQAFMNIKGKVYTIDIIYNALNEPKFQELSSPIKHTHISFNTSIQFNNLSFFYGQQPVLQNLELTIPKGKTVGIIGESGSGKSTLMNILLRFLQESSGALLVDGTVLTQEHENAWRTKIGYVPQDVFVLHGTLLENVAFGIAEHEIDMHKATLALQKAQLHTLVEQLPKGLHTVIEEGGKNLSGGQKQRLAIARALYKGAEILIFDEATSALDNQTEMEITQAIQSIQQNNLTIIVVAHRYSTLKYCDEIFHMEKGRIVRTSTYDELMNLVVKKIN